MPGSPLFHSKGLPIAFSSVVLLVGLSAVLVLWSQTSLGERRAAEDYFGYRSRDALARIETRLHQYEQALVDARGVFDTLGTVSRRQFRSFVAGTGVSRNYPGIQGIGFSQWIEAADLDRHVADIRRQGYPGYEVRPPGIRDGYSAIVYLEPFSGRNLRAFGYDMYSEAVRRAAMGRAAATNAISLSGKVQLVQETDQDVQAGFLVYLPVYASGRLSGWVYAPFRVNDFMRGLLGEGEDDLDLEIYDGTEVSPETRMYDRTAAEPGGAPNLTQVQSLTYGGHTWTVRTLALPGLQARRGPGNSPMILGLGIPVSILAAVVAALILLQLRRARQHNEVLEARVAARTDELRLQAGFLEQERLRLASILAGTNVGTWEWNVQTGETTFNERWAEILGYTLGELAPVSIETWVRLAHPEDLKLSNALLEQAFRRELPYYEAELRMRHKDGSWRWVHDRGSVASWTEDGKPWMMMGTHTDITRRVEETAEKAALADHNHQLQKKASLGQMAGSVAHYFNNRLQPIRTSLELLRMRNRDSQWEGSLSRGLHAVEQAEEVTRLLLTYLGQTTLKQEHLALSRVLPTPPFWSPVPPSPEPLVLGHADQLRQLASCLISNAKEASGDSPDAVRVTLKTCRASEIPAGHRFPMDWKPGADGYLCLEVADSGDGIAPHRINQLFDPFFTTKQPGRGLGLAVALGIAEAHRAVITVESALEKGSAFRVFFPVSDQKDVPTPPEPEAPSWRTTGRTVLVVDDDPMVLESAGELVALLGHPVLLASGGQEALDLFQAHADDIGCVLTDLTMPGMDGWTLLSSIRARRPGFPVILVSGYDRSQVLEEARPDIPSAILAKPFDMDQLERKLAEILPRKNTP